ncbi:undecaprenyl-phosphate glucose phosphotransferase [Beggiatoa leptomitoformis]|uniref:Undecaprenyl-phosphate glucose phosphotransferase n=1 Tax=Beggiatoa leptomitoformis TaxID=288004 RepID=A0A2N9YJ54_9GAMM|nr:undecaprenyl-phosphate glucose phosphotransferase [Beggiatoa leptomitoformis]ALG67530.1 undecaprenyl-phosphate glucose phosphotransferase [Beggiatoa leptomitoformis]AUI70246.1 undecaprenyl-phosphate glucose phosphotransferase [Beggiatoa leptomitoformis]
MAGGLIRPHHAKLAVLFRLVDALWIGGTLWLLAWQWNVFWEHSYYLSTTLLAMGLFFFIAEFNNLYHSWRGGALVGEIQIIWRIWFLVTGILLILGFTFKASDYLSRSVILTWLVFVPIILSLWRLTLRSLLGYLRESGRNGRTAIIIGADTLGIEFAKTLLERPETGIRLYGFCDDFKPVTEQPLIINTTINCLGTPDVALELARTGAIDLVYIALPMKAETRIQELVTAFADATASVYILLPDLFMLEMLHARLVNFGDFSAVSIYETPFSGYGAWIKRLEDMLLASFILTLISIPMLVIACLIRFTSKGEILFKQYRYGLNGEVIEVWKFRTMHVCENGEQVTQAQRNDPRITALGGFLRRTSLDELPQFINVLQGRMSIVGPRPHAVAHNEQYRKLIPRYMLRHKVKPGITGWAQINGWRGETDTLEKMAKRVEYDLEYIRNWSVWLDLEIIFATIYKGFLNKNAY